MAIALLALCFAAPAAARTVPLTDANPVLDYGPRQRGDVFTDTLAFVTPTGDTLVVEDAEVTCDCVTARALPGGQLAFRFHVEADEPDGSIEKLIYLFTRSAEFDLLRLALRVEVLPNTGSSPPGPGGKEPVRRIDPLNERKVTVDSGGETPLDQGGRDNADTTGTGREETAQRPSPTSQPGPGMSVDSMAGDRSVRPGTSPLRVGFFYSPGCRTCAKIREHTLPALRERWGDAIEIVTVDLDRREGFNRLLAVRQRYGVTERGGSFLFAVGDTTLQSSAELFESLNGAISRALERGHGTYLAEDQAAAPADEAPEATAIPPGDPTRSVFRSLSFWTVAGAGLLDGINPCAFATIVFFISLLGYAGSTRRQVLLVGIGFTAAVFTVYLLLGLGAFRALQALSAYHLVAQIIAWVTVLLLLLLAGMSIRDTVRYLRTGQTSDALLQLPRRTKRRIHNAMRRGLNTRNLLLAAVGTGALVTLFEAACTGQVYLPAIVLMTRDPLLADRALLYLVIYNLLFIAPLIVVFAGAYFGVKSQAFAAWQRRHYAATRVALSLLFVALAAMMLMQV